MLRYLANATSVDVRKEPSVSSDAAAFLKRGDLALLLEKSPNLYWFKIQTPAQEIGWVAHKFLTPLQQEKMYQAKDPEWLKVAINEIGVKEYPGDADNPRIIEYHQSTTLDHDSSSQDETAWCSSFVNWCFEKAGYAGTDSAWARSWLNWGIKLATPRRGCVVVFARIDPIEYPEDTKGHVAFFIEETASDIKVIGGNQDDAVNEQGRSRKLLLGYRWPGVSHPQQIRHKKGGEVSSSPTCC